jgi:hypothetical protein
MFQHVGLHGLAPGMNEQSFDDWWKGTSMAATGLLDQYSYHTQLMDDMEPPKQMYF